jgi:DNA-binding CsgD family transcriptional regulator
MARSTITEQDVRGMLAIAQGYGSREGSSDARDPLPWGLLHDLYALVPCDTLSVSGQDTLRWDFFAGRPGACRLGDQELPESPMTPAQFYELAAAYRRHYWDSPASYPDRTGDVTSVWRISDLVSDREYRQSGMYAELDRPLGVAHGIMVTLEAGAPQRTLRLWFERGHGQDFSDRDVALLVLLRPHLQQAWFAAERRRRGVLPLTVRQQEILRFVAAGYSNGQIARRLQVSEATVAKHMENIFARLQVTNRAAAVAQVLRP